MTSDTAEGRDLEDAFEVSALEVMLEAGQEVMQELRTQPWKLAA